MIASLRTLLLCYRSHLRVQPTRELMAIAGVAAGVALLFTVQVAHRSITGSFEELRHGVAGHATLELAARGPEGFDQQVAEQVEAMPGVKVAAPILEQPIVAVGPKGRRALTLVGATEQVNALEGRFALAFQHASKASQRGLLLLTAPTASAIGVRPGDEVTILVGEHTRKLALDTTISSNEIGAAAGSPVAASALPIVQLTAGLPGRITRILIEPQSGREQAVRRALSARFGSTLNVRGVNAEAELLGNAAAPEKQITLLFSAISLVAGILIAYNALLLASDRRREFVHDLVDEGAPDSLVVSSLVFDAVIVGLAGSLLGLLAGDLISLVAYRSVPGYIAAAFAIGAQRLIDLQTIALAVVSGLLAALAAASLPAISILRNSTFMQSRAARSPLSAASNIRLYGTPALAGGLALVGASVGLALVAPVATVIALVGIAVGLVICLPTVLRLLLRGASRAARRSSHAPAKLSVVELRTASSRSVALFAIGTVAAFLTIVINGSVANVKTAASNGAGGLMSSAAVWIKPGGAENVYTTQPFHYGETQHRVEQAGEVRSVLAWRDSFLDLKRRRVWVLGVPPQQATQIVPSQLVHGSLEIADRRIREGGWVAVSQPIASEYHVRIGQRMTIPTPKGDRSFRVAATIANYGWLPGAIVMNGNDHAQLWQSSTATQLAVAVKPDIPIWQAKQAVERALPPHSALSVKTAGERRAEVSAVLGSTLSRLNDTTLVVLVATIASVIALMISASWQRRGRLNELMAEGWSTLQFASLISYETGAVLLSGCAIGIGAGLGGQSLIDRWLRHTTGASVHFAPAYGIALRTLVIAGLISSLATLIALVQTRGFQPRAAFSNE